MKPVRIAVLVFSVLAATSVFAKGHPAQQADNGKIWDSGSFGVFVNGRRVATEKFEIEQTEGSSRTVSEFKMQRGSVKAEQKADMELAPSGNLVSYTWQATRPKKEETRVDFKNQLLVEHVTPDDQKEVDIKHFLPASTVILDDNFFSQREVLLWHYLATCSRTGGDLACKPATFAVLIPQQHVSLDATVRLLGQEKAVANGLEKEFIRVELDMRAPQQVFWLNEKPSKADTKWILWVDKHYKLVKITVPGTNVQVLRAGQPPPVSVGALHASPQK
ncbi:MAG: hypothetical protein ACM3SW_09655 [Actinomycetota bacterium]